MHYSLESYIRKHKKFPDEADPSGLLGALADMINNVIPHSNLILKSQGKQERKIELPFRINLLAITDNPGFYIIRDDYPEGIYSTSYPEPFKADNEEDATKKLQIEIEKYNKKHDSLFVFGILEKRNSGKPGLLSKVERNMPLIIEKNMSRYYIEEHCA